MYVGVLSKAPNAIRVLEKVLSGHRLTVIQTREELIAEAERLEVLITSSIGFGFRFVDDEVLVRARSLKLIQQFGVAVDAIDVNRAKELNIPVANVPGLNTVAVAELGIYLIFALARKARILMHTIEKRRLAEPIGTEVTGKILGIVGLGRIGTALALRAKGLGMVIMAVTGHPAPGEERILGIDLVQTPDRLNYLLSRSDFVVLTLPLNEKTRGLMGPEEFANMKQGAYLINLSRGLIVDRKALIQALQAGTLGGFATDVAWDEPADPNDWIFSQPNVILTPHIGATTTEALESASIVIRDNIERVARGEKPLFMLR